MFPGRYSLCLKTVDFEGMARFYGAIGMTTRTFAGNNAMAWNGDVHLALMGFLDEHSMNFRGADPVEVHKAAGASGIGFEGKPTSYRKEETSASADGSCWVTHDPDGNNVFFDTNKGEIGAIGAAHYLLKILDCTRRQLVNIEAPEACRDAFESEVVAKFVTPEVKRLSRLELTPLPEPGTYPGHFTYCLKTADAGVSRDWYRALGLTVGTPSEGRYVMMNTSDCRLALMEFLSENWLNFRGADVFRVFDQMNAAGLELEGEPARYTEEEYGSPGAHWQTRDPDGNIVYFDTTDAELIVAGDPGLCHRTLARACRQLEDANCDAECIDAVREVAEEAFR